MTPSYLSVVAELKARAEKVRKDAIAQLEHVTSQKAEEFQRLSNATHAFLTLGYAEVSWDKLGYIDVRCHGIGWGQRGFHWLRYFREVAREARRPLVTVGANFIRIPRRRYTEPLTAGFALLAESVVRVEHATNYRVFHFAYEANSLIDTWKAQCATDPVFRRALRLQ